MVNRQLRAHLDQHQACKQKMFLIKFKRSHLSFAKVSINIYTKEREQFSACQLVTPPDRKSFTEDDTFQIKFLFLLYFPLQAKQEGR